MVWPDTPQHRLLAFAIPDAEIECLLETNVEMHTQLDITHERDGFFDSC